MLGKHLDKNNLHHAYLIEGTRDEVAPLVLKFVAELGVETVGNPDFINISVDSFKIDDARNLKSFASEKGMTLGKKVFLISANSLLLEAQHSLLKMFEEPIENTHFFVTVPDTNSLLKTLVSRFYLIVNEQDLAKEVKEAEAFLGMTLPRRIDFIKELLVEPEEEDEDKNEIILLDSTRSKSLKFLNALETVLHEKLPEHLSLRSCFEHFFKVRELLRMPGASAKTLMESVALITPKF